MVTFEEQASAMRGRRVVIFGAGGQDGPFVAQACLRRGAQVFGFARRTPPACDVSDFAAVESVIRERRPDFVFQLAAESRTAHEALFSNHAAIAGGAVNVLEAIRRHAPQARVLLAGSGVQFHNAGRPIHESDAFDASSPYAAARIYATYLARYFRQRMGLATYVAYLFHHESPARGERHTSMMIARAAAQAEMHGPAVLELGDVGVEKEWAYAGDIAEAMVRLVLQDAVSECVVGTGEGHSIADWLTACYQRVGLDWREHVRIKPGFKAEYPRLVSNPETIMGLGWWPETSFQGLAEMMLDAARRSALPNGGGGA